MKKYNIVKINERLYYQTEDKSSTIRIEDLKDQLILDMQNGIKIEICDTILMPIVEINSAEDVFNELFKNAGDSKENLVVLTSYLFDFVKEWHTTDAPGYRRLQKDEKVYYFNTSYDRNANKGLIVPDETIKKIESLISRINGVQDI